MGEIVRRVPGWAGFPWLTAGFSGRAGGLSRTLVGGGEPSGGAKVEAELNLSFVPQDDPAAVTENRRRLLDAVGGAERWQLAVSRQVHGVRVRELTAENYAEAMVDERGQWECDGLITRAPGFLLAVATADCVPVLIADTARHAVGAFHAGWRGTAAGMAAEGLRAMHAAFGTRPENCIAAIGPAIGACCYEVGEEVRAAFADCADPGAATLFEAVQVQPRQRPGGWRLDLWEANRRQLVAAGVPSSAVSVLGECTVCSRESDGRRRYFSYRAEAGVTGRMFGVIGILP